MADLKLDVVNVVLYDHQHNIRAIVRSTLDGIGFRQIHQCRSLREARDVVERLYADLMIVDLDEDFRATCELINDVRYERVGTNPFVVVIGITWEPHTHVIESALDAGVDDLVRKPISARLLAERITNLIHNRKGFIATPEYVGPLRAEGVGPSAASAQYVVVPNSLRDKSTGEIAAEAAETETSRAAQTVSLRRLHGLASEIGSLAAGLGDQLLSGDRCEVLRANCARIADLSGRFNELAATSRVPNLDRLALALANLTVAVTGAADPTPRHFEILHLHAQAIAAITRGEVNAIDDVAAALGEAAALLTDSLAGPAGIE